MSRFLTTVFATTLASVVATTAHAQFFDSRDVMGFGPNFFAGSSSPISREVVMYAGPYAPGTVVINTSERRLYLVLQGGRALRYGIGVGRDGFRWSGVHRISAKREWPSWTPPKQMLRRRLFRGGEKAGGRGNVPRAALLPLVPHAAQQQPFLRPLQLLAKMPLLSYHTS